MERRGKKDSLKLNPVFGYRVRLVGRLATLGLSGIFTSETTTSRKEKRKFQAKTWV
jgi:hypothetical protein